MSKHYNIIEQLKAKNEKPSVMIGEGFSVVVNTEYTNGLMIQALEKDDSLSEVERLNKGLEILIGKKSVEKLNKLNLTTEAYMYVVEAIFSAMSGEDLEDEERFPEGNQ